MNPELVEACRRGDLEVIKHLVTNKTASHAFDICGRANQIECVRWLMRNTSAVVHPQLHDWITKTRTMVLEFTTVNSLLIGYAFERGHFQSAIFLLVHYRYPTTMFRRKWVNCLADFVRAKHDKLKLSMVAFMFGMRLKTEQRYLARDMAKMYYSASLDRIETEAEVFFKDLHASSICSTCYSDATFVCDVCKKVANCSGFCQERDWTICGHNNVCKIK